MRWFKYLLIAALAIVPAPAINAAGFLLLAKSGGGSVPVVTYVGSVSMSNFGATTFSASTFDIGNPSYISTRRVIVVLDGGANSANPTSATINGVSADFLSNTSGSCSGSNCVEYVSAVVPTGTTGVTISVTFAFTLNVTAVWSVYIVDNSLLSAPTSPVVSYAQDTSSGGTVTTTVNTTTKSGGFIVTGEWCGGGAGPSITSSTETYTSDYSASAEFNAHANGISSNASNSVSTQCPPAGGNVGLALAAWR